MFPRSIFTTRLLLVNKLRPVCFHTWEDEDKFRKLYFDMATRCFCVTFFLRLQDNNRHYWLWQCPNFQMIYNRCSSGQNLGGYVRKITLKRAACTIILPDEIKLLYSQASGAWMLNEIRETHYGDTVVETERKTAISAWKKTMKWDWDSQTQKTVIQRMRAWVGEVSETNDENESNNYEKKQKQIFHLVWFSDMIN